MQKNIFWPGLCFLHIYLDKLFNLVNDIYIYTDFVFADGQLRNGGHFSASHSLPKSIISINWVTARFIKTDYLAEAHAQIFFKLSRVLLRVLYRLLAQFGLNNFGLFYCKRKPANLICSRSRDF